MNTPLYTFQETVIDRLLKRVKIVRDNDDTPRCISFTAPTGAGKTIMMTGFIEDVFCGTQTFPPDPDAIFVWLSDAPELNKQTFDKTLEFFEIQLKMLHPFMPFITEELWQHLYDRKEGESIMRDSLKLPAPSEADDKLAAQIESVKQIVSGVRMVRSSKNIAPKEQLELQAIGKNDYEPFNSIISKMANLNAITVVAEKDATASAFMVGTDEFAVPLGNMIDAEAEIQKMEAQLQHLEGFLAGVKKKLSNERFVANAPEAVVALERKKQSDSEEKIAALKESIAALKK